MHRAKFAALRTSFEELLLLRQEVTDKKYFFLVFTSAFRLLFAFFVIFCWPFVLSCIMASRHHLSDCEKDMVASVHSFIEEENQLGRRLSVRNVRRRTSLACGVSESTVTRCCRRSLGESYYRAMDNVENNEENRGRPKIVMDDFLLSAIRLEFHGFFSTKGGAHVRQGSPEVQGKHWRLP